MTKEQFLVQLRDKHPVYRKFSDEELLQRIYEKFVGAPQTIGVLLQEFKVNPGLFLGWVQRRQAEQEATTLKAKAVSVQALEQIQTAMNALTRSIPASIYPQVILEEEKARIEVWKEEELIRLKEKHAEVLMRIKELEAELRKKQ